MADDKLQIEVVDGARSGEQIIQLEGVLNAETAFQFRDAVRQYEPETLVIDMSRVRYMDSSGIGVLIGLYASFERKYKRLLLAGLNDRIWELFRICKIDDVFTRYRTVADAEQTDRHTGIDRSSLDSAEPVPSASRLQGRAADGSPNRAGSRAQSG